jgi:hypothetical protein
MLHLKNDMEPCKKHPLSFNLLLIIIVSCYFIYIPVMYFKSSSFLIIQDLLLIIAIVFTIFSKRKLGNMFGGNSLMFFSVLIYLCLLFFRVILDIEYITPKYLMVFRNLLFGVGILFVSSTWIDNKKMVDTFLSFTVLLTFITSLYGFKQLIFGFTNFELDRLSIMGSSLQEFESLNRTRLTSSFGDPLVFSFFMMIGTYFYFLAKNRNVAVIITQKLHPYSIVIIFISLLLTLTRAPLFGLIIGFVLYQIFTFRKNSYKISSNLLKVIALFFLILFFKLAISSNFFSESNNPFIISLNNGIESFNSLLQIAKDVDIDSEEYFLIGQSKDARSNAWKEGFYQMLNTPLGSGLTNGKTFSFSLDDVGLLSIGLQIGILGFFVVLSFYVIIGFQSFYHISQCKEEVGRKFGYLLFSLWISIFITSGISSIFDNSIISTLTWTIAGISLNQKKIHTSFNK